MEVVKLGGKNACEIWENAIILKADGNEICLSPMEEDGLRELLIKREHERRVNEVRPQSLTQSE